MNELNIEEMLRHCMHCALWSSVGDNDEPLDQNHGIEDISPETMKAIREDCEAFAAKAQALIIESNLTVEQIGHDFWLTRNRHGTGFWDRGETGKKLSVIAQEFNEVWFYEGDDGLIYHA